jgi:hypothetical protein
MDSSELTDAQRAALEALSVDLRRIFGVRLHSVVAYGPPAPPERRASVHTLVLVERISFEDLAACVPSSGRWRRLGLEVPLIISRHEFLRTLDVFPIEYAGIIESHVIIEGRSPFEGANVAEADLRRACEHQAKSHLIHLREGFLESGGEPHEISRLIRDSVPAFRTLLISLTLLDRQAAGNRTASDHDVAEAAHRAIGIPAALVREVFASPAAATTVADPTALLARYIEAAEQIWGYVEQWRRG